MFMEIALEEAKQSLRDGNKGFGAVLVKDGAALERTHDTTITDSDPTAHAELKLVRLAAARKSTGIEGCAVVSTHEPCPMCTGALVWGRASEIVYGTSIERSKELGRTMIDLKCEDVVSRAPWKPRVIGGVLAGKCSRLYDSSVRSLVKQIRGAGQNQWINLGSELTTKRLKWFEQNKDLIHAHLQGNDVEKAYQLILMKIGVNGEEAQVVSKSDSRMVFHSTNPCPALDACEILGLDTRTFCRLHTEGATDALIKGLNPELTFMRNYSKLRPASPFCEEIIELRREDS